MDTVKLNDLSISKLRAIKAFKIRNELGTTYKELGVLIGNIKDGSPITTMAVKRLCEKGERILRTPWIDASVYSEVQI